jgi:hypothetical protein
VHELLERLRDGDPADAAAATLTDPPLIAVLLDGMRSGDSAVQANAADAAEQAARERPELLASHADALIEIASTARESEVRRNAAQMLARVELSDERAVQASELLERYLDDGSPAVEAWALSAIVALANEHPDLRTRAREAVHARADSEAPPVRERARLLVDQADSWPSGAGTA